ncbi:MAG TPA: MMPL family transporter [Gemmataceae bacterium]|nr:MMPL family transporter [Gemmataceae bacterium]
MTTFYAWLARCSLRHRWKLLATWVVILGLAAFGAARVSHALSVGGFSLPGTEFHAASTILARDLHLSPDKTALVVYHSDRLWVTDDEYYQAVEDSLRSLGEDKCVSKTESFYKTGIPDWVSPDNRTTYAWVRLEGSEKELEEATPRLRHRAASDVLQVYLIGQPAANYDIETASTQDLLRVERITFPIIFVVLVLVFRSVVAALIPLLLGMVSVCVSLAFLYLLAQVTEVSIFALNTASMIGLGLAVDFSLILVSRYREELASRPMSEALEIMLRTSGRSITFSGVTLMLTMAVLILFPVMVINSIALAITIVAAVAVLTALLLLPPLLAILGPHLNRLSMAPFLSWAGSGDGGRWRSWAHAIMRWPWLSTIAALAILALMAAPAGKLKRSGVTAQVLPPESVSRQGVELIQRQFGPGEAAPLFVVVEASRPGGLWQPEILEAVYDLHAHLEKDPRVAHVTSLATLIPNPTGEWMQSLSPATIGSNPDRGRIAERLANLDGTNQTTLLVVYPRQIETHPETVELMLDLRRNAKVWASGLSNTRVLVGGTPAQHYDFDRVVYDQLPLLLTLSLFLTFIILMLFFHSLILPVKAILLNVVSLVASYGVLVLVFQFGVLDSLLGFHSLGAILSYTPVLLFSILFGLSTDYEVFLLTRVREYVRQGYSNEASVALGLERTASIITAAGLIMIAVFGSFALTRVLVIKELGFGLAVAVFLDTTLVRIVLVPATMKLMGRWNWWMPRPLGGLVPELDEEEAPLPKQTVLQPVERAALVHGGKG